MDLRRIFLGAAIIVTIAAPLHSAATDKPVRELAQEISLLCYETLERNERLLKEVGHLQQRWDSSDEHKEKLSRLEADLRWSEIQLVNEGCHSVFAMEALLSSEAKSGNDRNAPQASIRSSYCAIEDSLADLRQERAALNRRIDSLGTTSASGAAEREELLRQMDRLNEKTTAYSQLDALKFCEKSSADRIQQPGEWRIQQCLMAAAGVAAVQSAISDARSKMEAAYAHRRIYGKSRVLYVEFDERGHPTKTLESKKREVESFITKERRNLRAYELVMSELSCPLPRL